MSSGAVIRAVVFYLQAKKKNPEDCNICPPPHCSVCGYVQRCARIPATLIARGCADRPRSPLTPLGNTVVRDRSWRVECG